jgi:hypothetical protein
MRARAFIPARYFVAFFLFAFASASRSVFLRREARFLTLSLPLLFPITAQHSPVLSHFQTLSQRPGAYAPRY